MNPDGLDAERRRQRAYERLRTYEPACLHCGEDDPECLELHHVAGQRFMAEDGLVIECRNCHRKLSSKQKDHPNPRIKPMPQEVVLARFLMGIADLFELLIGHLRKFAAQLFEAHAKQPPSKEEDRR